MKRFYNAVLLLSLLGQSGKILAQQLGDDSLKFSVKINYGNNQHIPTQAVVAYNKIDWFPSSNLDYLKIRIDTDGKFEFKLPNLNKPYKISFLLRNNENKVSWSYLFYVEPKDSINISITKNIDGDSNLFSGKGSEKYNTIVRLKKLWELYWEELGQIRTLDPIKDLTGLDARLNKLNNLARKFNTEKSHILSLAQLNPEMRMLINYDPGQYDFNGDWSFRMTLLYKTFVDYRDQIGKNYLQYNKEFYIAPNNLALYTSSYIEGLAKRVILEEMIAAKSDKADVKAVYNSLKLKYTGSVRDKLLGISLLNKVLNTSYKPYKSSTIDSITTDAVQTVSLSYVKEALVQKLDILGKTRPTKPVHDSEFNTRDGKKFNTSLLKGKVILFDVWFNGCRGCAFFHNAFEKTVYPQFKNNKDFVVLSISMDKTKDLWIKGMASKYYTSDEYINVWSGDGLNHPFLKYYKITGGPWFMVVDANGNIVYQPNGGSAEELKLKIAEALNETKSRSK